MTERQISRRGLLAAAGTALAGGIAGCEAPSSDAPSRDAGEAGSVPTVSGEANAYTAVYQQTVDSVVLIRQTGPRGGQGSGFVFRNPGGAGGGTQYLLTNEHVVSDADSLEILYSAEDWRTGEVLATDYYSDLAVAEVANPPDYATELPLVKEEPPIGTRIVAIGNPFGLEETVTAGIISGTNRSMEVDYSTRGGFSIPDAIQTDAALNPGNSGGPLLTLGGSVVGVVRAGRGDNVGFGISAALTRRVATGLIEEGEYQHSYMGVGLAPVSPTIAEANDLDTTRGVIVTSVLDGSPSDGVLEGSNEGEQDGVPVPIDGDVITALGGTEITTLNELSTFLALETSPGDTITVTVIRDGSRTEVDLTLGAIENNDGRPGTN
ncbi:MAG: S1C family serine protease [Halobacteriales archaeon]